MLNIFFLFVSACLVNGILVLYTKELRRLAEAGLEVIKDDLKSSMKVYWILISASALAWFVALYFYGRSLGGFCVIPFLFIWAMSLLGFKEVRSYRDYGTKKIRGA